MTAIVDYKAGNLTSVRNAFAALGTEVIVTDDPAVIGRIVSSSPASGPRRAPWR